MENLRSYGRVPAPSNYRIPGVPAGEEIPYQYDYDTQRDMILVQSSSFQPPKRLKDVIFTPAFNRARYEVVSQMYGTGGRIQYELKDPITGQSLWVHDIPEAGQGEGF